MSELLELGKNACDAKYVLQKLTTEEKNKALQTAANDLCERQEEILAANVLDLENGKNNGMNPGLLDRLKLTGERIAQIAEGLRQIAALPDCIGETMEHFERPNGLKIDKVRVPLGVIGIIYEARPNVTADAFGLCFKTGNAVILKGGSDAIHSNIAIVKVLQDALEACSMPRTAVQLIEDTDRAVTAQFMKMKEYVDVLIPRGGAGLIRAVVENSTVPVIETGTGNCHIYVDESVRRYIAHIVEATRKHSDIALGVNPRGTLAYLRCCQAYAAIEARDFVTPDDVKKLCVPVLGHRIVAYRAEQKETILQSILEQVEVPTEYWKPQNEV